GFKAARLPIGDAFLELVQPEQPEGRFYEQVKERGEGVFSISVEVDDLDEAVAYLRGKDIKVSEPEASIWPGARLARINHEYTHGVSIQLIERRQDPRIGWLNSRTLEVTVCFLCKMTARSR